MTLLVVLYLFGLGFAVYLHYDDAYTSPQYESKKDEAKRLESTLEPYLKAILWPLHFLVFILWVWLEGIKAVID